MTDDFLSTMIAGAPNFIGLLIATYLQHKIIKELLAQITTLQNAIIRRENCDENSAEKAL